MKNTSLLKIFIGAIVLSTYMFLIGLLITYVKVDRSSPAGDEASVPASKTD